MMQIRHKKLNRSRELQMTLTDTEVHYCYIANYAFLPKCYYALTNKTQVGRVAIQCRTTNKRSLL